MKKKGIQGLLLVLRLAVALLILYFLWRKTSGQWHVLQTALAGTLSRWPWWLGGLLCLFAGLSMGALRWHLILMAQGFSIPFHRVFRIFFIGVFFNAFMLGACGGDLVRAVYATLEVPGRRTEAAATALIDRIVGLLTMILFCCIIILLRWAVFWNRLDAKGPALLILGFFVLSLAGVAFIFSHNLFERWSFVRRIEEKTFIGPRLRRVYDAFYLYRRRKKVLLLAGLFSVINMIMQTLACVCFGISLGLKLEVLDYFTVVPIIIILSSIPITPGALGIREGLFVHMFQIFNVEAALSLPLSVMLFMGGVFWSVFGGVLFMLHSASSGHTVREEIARLNEERDTPTDASVSPTGMKDSLP